MKFLLSVLAALYSFTSFSQTNYTTVEVTPTISTSAYAVGDAVGGQMDFSNAVDASGSAILNGVVIVDRSEQSAAMVLVCFDRDFTETADNAALAISDADAANVVAKVTIAANTYTDIGGSTVSTSSNLGQVVKSANLKTISCQLATTGTPTYTSTSALTVKLRFVRQR